MIVMAMTRVDPRIERTRTAVLDGAIEVISDLGFGGATIDAIARRCGVARSTIYRHWPDRLDLLLEAVSSRIGPVENLTTGNLRSDLIAIASRLARLLTTEPMGSVVASLILESRRDPQLEELRQRFVAARQDAVGRVTAAAVEAGRLPSTVDSSAVATDLASPIFFRALILREPIEHSWLEAQVDHWLLRIDPEET